MATNPDSIFADLIPGAGQGAASGPIYGAPVKVDVPSGYEPDPAKPGAFRAVEGGPADPNATADTLDPQTISFYAQQVLTGAPLPPMGMGKQASKMRAEVMKEVAKQAGAMGMSGNEFAAQVAHYKAGTASLTKMQTMHDQIRSAEDTALRNGKQLIELSNTLPGQGGGPILNTITQAWERHNPYAEGHDQIAAYDAAYTTFVNEYAKVVSGSPSGAGVLSDSARHEAMETLRKSTDPSQKRAAFAQMEKDMANRMDAIQAVIQNSYKNLSGRYDQVNVPENPAQAQLPSDWVKKHPDSLAALGVAGNTGNGPPGDGGGGNGRGLGQLTPEQTDAFKAFIAKNGGAPTGDQVRTYLKGLLGVDDVPNADAIAKGIAAGKPINTTTQDLSYEDKLRARIAQEDKLGVGESPAEALSAQGRTFNLADEAAGVGNSLANALVAPFSSKTDFDPVGSYQFGRDAERMRVADARQQLGYGGTAIEFASGLGATGVSSALANITPRAAILASSAGGALGGYGAGEGAEGSLANAGVGAAAGGALAYAAPRVGNAILNRVTRAPGGMDPALGAAAAAEDVRISQPMIEGNRRAVNRAGSLEADPSTAAVIQQGFRNTAEDIGGGVGRLGAKGTAQDRAVMGETFREAAKNIQQVDRQGATAAYEAAEKAQPGVQVDPAEMRAKIDAKLVQLQRRPNQNREQILELKRYRADLNEPLPLQEIRDMRTEAHDNVSGMNVARSSSAKRADRFMMSIIDGAKSDIANALKPEALAAWQAADRQYADNQTLYRQALKPLFGDDFDKLSAEEIFDRVKAAANGNGRALAGFHRRLTAEQSRDFSATIAESLGRRSPEEDFSPALFAQQMRRFSPSARETIFGPSGAASIDNLLLLSRRLGRAQAQINTSKTARPVMGAVRDAFRRNSVLILSAAFGSGAAGLGGGIEGAGLGAAAGGAAALIGAMRRGMSARALMNPRVSRWLADAADASAPQQAKELTKRLGGIIAREPSIANDLTPLYDALNQRLTMPLAAEPAPEGQQDDQQ